MKGSAFAELDDDPLHAFDLVGAICVVSEAEEKTHERTDIRM